MQTIADYLNAVAKTTETGTDYAVAQALGLSTSHIANYKKNRTPDDNICLLIAEKLNIEPWEVIAAANAERQIRLANQDQAEKWVNLWRRVRRGGTTAIIALAALGSSDGISTAYAQSVAEDDSILYAAIQRLQRWLARFLYTPPHALTA